MSFDPSFFFDLVTFEHRGLFGAGEPAWKAIANLPWYLESMLVQVGRDPYRAARPMRRFPKVHISEPDRVIIAESAVIKPFTVIEGPAIIDERAVVGPGAYLRGGVIIGRGAEIGHGTEVKGSVVFPFARAKHANRILDSLIGWRVNLAAHLVTFNLRRDGRTVPIHLQDGRHLDTGLRKLGIIAGDGCFFSGDVRFNPGNHFLPDTRL